MIFVFTEITKGGVKKSSLESVNYAYKLAEHTNNQVTAMAIDANESQLAAIGKAGAHQIINTSLDIKFLHEFQNLAKAVVQIIKDVNPTMVIFAHDLTGKSLAPYVAAILNAGFVSGITNLPSFNNTSCEVSKNIFSGKATATYQIDASIKVFTLMPGSFSLVEYSSNNFKAESKSLDQSLFTNKLTITETQINTMGEMVPLPEAELVVSGGRGLKDPSNWHILEDLAKSLKATTACSRPVADLHWRPHHEHVGQTGVAIRPKLYIAIGISGAIQHLAGVNGSQTIVVINNDQEAPFFKSADYGILGDAFTIVPKLTAAINKFNSEKN